VLVGINESGKSNILKALSLLDETVNISKNDIRDPGHDEDAVAESYVRFVFQMDKALTAITFESIKERFLSNSLSTALLDIDGKPCSLETFCRHKNEVLYQIDILTGKRQFMHWQLAGTKYRIHPSWKKVKKGVSFQFNHHDVSANLASYSVVNTNDMKEIPAEHLEDLDVNSFNAIVGGQLLKTAEDNLPPCIVWNYTEDNLLPSKINLAEFTSQPTTCTPLKNMFSLAGYRDVTKALQEASKKTNGITNMLRKVGENTTAHMRKVWPEWNEQRVVLSQNGEHIDAGIEDHFNIYSLSRRSDGFKRFFTFLLMISVQNVIGEIADIGIPLPTTAPRTSYLPAFLMNCFKCATGLSSSPTTKPPSSPAIRIRCCQFTGLSLTAMH
jgi:hypothetical protein